MRAEFHRASSGRSRDRAKARTASPSRSCSGQKNLEPMMTELRITREKLVAIGSEHVNEKEIKGLAAVEASVLAKLIVGNARMQSKIYRVLGPD
jgi:hypothetical protein